MKASQKVMEINHSIHKCQSSIKVSKRTPSQPCHRSLIRFMILAVIVAFSINFSACRALIYNVPDITDHEHFPSRHIMHDPGSIFYFSKSGSVNSLGERIYANRDFLLPDVVSLDDYIEKSKTAAFIIIRNDSILYERYNKDYQENSIFNTFSVTKVFITTLVGIAIEEGLIQSVDQPITDYIPELLDKEGFSDIKIRHLLLHTSGIKFTESKYNPLSDNARYYYGRNLRKLVLKAKLYEKPGIETHYGSANLQLLGMILERATNSNISGYMQEKVWQKIGMQYDATWSTDFKRKDPMEKSFSSLNCTAIDLAKLGRLYLNHGIWENQQLTLPETSHE